MRQATLARCMFGRPASRVSTQKLTPLVPWGTRSLPRPVEWVVEGLVQRDAVSVLAGEPGVGKTSIVLGLAAAAARGRSFLEHDVIQGPEIFIHFDDLSESLLSSDGVASG